MVVVDSFALIPLIRIGRLDLLEKYFKKIKITKEVYEELIAGLIGVSEFEKACKSWIIANKELFELERLSELENIEKADASVILFAQKEKDILLSGDLILINTAKSKNIECLWLTAFILKCIEKEIVSKEEAKQILLDMIQAGIRLKNDVYSHILKRIDEIKLDKSHNKIDAQKAKDESRRIWKMD